MNTKVTGTKPCELATQRCRCQQIKFLLPEEAAGRQGKGRLGKVTQGGEELAKI